MKKSVICLLSALLGSQAGATLAKAYVGKDDHGKPCELLLTFQDGRVNGIMVQALADRTSTKSTEKVWEIMIPEQFDKLIKQSGNLQSGKFYFQANDKLVDEQGSAIISRRFGLALNLKAKVLQYENRLKSPGLNDGKLMKCVGLEETEVAAEGLENDPCDAQPNAALRNMCKVENGKKKGTIPPGAVASPMIGNGDITR
jgi:hypothetical protein